MQNDCELCENEWTRQVAVLNKWSLRDGVARAADSFTACNSYFVLILDEFAFLLNIAQFMNNSYAV